MKKVAVCSWVLLLSFILSSNVLARRSKSPFPYIQGTCGVIGSAVAQENLADSIFDNAGNYTFFQKQGTSAGDVEDRNTPTLWIKVLGNQEKIKIGAKGNNGAKLKTTYYGAVAGLDFDRQYSDNFDATYGFFVSYIGNELKFDKSGR